MGDVLVFADEAGNFDFRRHQGASRYFTICSVTASDTVAGDAILDMRRTLAWSGQSLENVHSAAEAKQRTRDAIFPVIASSDLRIDATLLEKSKAEPHLHSEVAMYKMAWWLHFKYVAPKIVSSTDRLLVVASDLGTRKKRGAFLNALEDVVRQVVPVRSHQTVFWKDASEPRLWVADFSTWAIQRKYERGDDRSFRLIEHLVASVFKPFDAGSKHYY